MLFPPQTVRLRRLGARIGRAGEAAARRYLDNCGYDCLASNWRPPHGGGEVDLVALSRTGQLCFIEVKTRRIRPGQKLDEVAPLLAVDGGKRHHLLLCAKAYRQACGHLRVPARFDVIEVWSRGTRPVSLRHWPNAFAEEKPRA